MAATANGAVEVGDSDEDTKPVSLADFQSKIKPALGDSVKASQPFKVLAGVRLPTAKSLNLDKRLGAEWTIRRVLADAVDEKTRAASYDVKFEDGHVETVRSGYCRSRQTC